MSMVHEHITWEHSERTRPSKRTLIEKYRWVMRPLCSDSGYPAVWNFGIEGESGKKLGRVRFKIINRATSAEIKPFVEDCIERSATIVTDGLKSYDFLDGLSVKHEKYVQSGANTTKENESRLEHVHLVISLLKRWLLGTHQGAVTPMHLSEYLDEFAFRFNRRTSMHRGKLFHRMIQQAVTMRPKWIKG